MIHESLRFAQILLHKESKIDNHTSKMGVCILRTDIWLGRTEESFIILQQRIHRCACSSWCIDYSSIYTIFFTLSSALSLPRPDCINITLTLSSYSLHHHYGRGFTDLLNKSTTYIFHSISATLEYDLLARICYCWINWNHIISVFYQIFRNKTTGLFVLFRHTNQSVCFIL